MLPWLAVWTSLLLILSSLEGSLDPRSARLSAVSRVSRHSCVADRLPAVVRFPAGPQVRLKTVDPHAKLSAVPKLASSRPLPAP